MFQGFHNIAALALQFIGEETKPKEINLVI